MTSKTQQLWEKQDQHKGDRLRLFGALTDFVSPEKALYPGSFVDIAPSFVFPDVTYADTDKRAKDFFDDKKGVNKILFDHGRDPHELSITFIHSDYQTLQLAQWSFDLLISLYAGFIVEPCTQFLRIGGYLLVNPSHGDAAIAAIDERYELVAAVLSRDGSYQLNAKNLDQYLQPKKPTALTHELIHNLGRGIGYTKPAFAYLFKRLH